MAWTYVGVSSVASASSGNIVLTEPSGVQEGDLLVAIISYRSNAAFTNADWTKGPEHNTGNTTANGTGSIGSGVLFYKVRGASAPTLTFTRTAGDIALGRIVAYRGVRVSSGLVTSTSTTLAAAATAVSVTGVTTTSARDLIVVGACLARNTGASAFDAATDPTTSSGTNSSQTGNPAEGTWQERADSSTSTGADCGLAIADALRATAGASGNLTLTAGTSARHVVVAAVFAEHINVSRTGETLTATPTLTGGTATGTASITGVTQSVTVSLLDGTVSTATNASASGETLSVTLSQVDGTVTGTASVTGETLTATPTLTDGAVTASASVSGEVQTVTPTLLDGSVSTATNASVSGETLTVTLSLVDGSPVGDANVTGETQSVTVALLDGAASGDAAVSGETLTATPSLLDGTVSAGGSITVPGETLELTPTLTDGVVTLEEAVVEAARTADAGSSNRKLWGLYQKELLKRLLKTPNKRAKRRKKDKRPEAEAEAEIPLAAMLAEERQRLVAVSDSLDDVETRIAEAVEAERKRIRRKRNNEAALVMLLAA